MSWRDYLPSRMQAEIASQEYQNAESDINQFQNLNQNIDSYRQYLQNAQKEKLVAGEHYISAINAIRANQGKEPYAGWPEEAMGNSRRVYPAVDRMGYPLTPQQEAMYAQASPRRVVPLTPAELAASRPAVRPSIVDTSYSGSGADFSAEEPAQATPSRVVELTPEELAAFNARNNFAQGPVQQQQEAAPLYPEREHELRRQDLRSKMLATNQLMTSLIQRNDPSQAETIRGIFKDRLEKMVDAEQLKSFDEGFAASTIKAELPAVVRNDRMINNIKSELLAAEKIQDKTDKIDRLQTIIPKLLQSAASGGSDAMQMGEFLLGAPEMQNYTRWATANRMDIGLSSLVKYINDPSIKDRFDVNPDSYLAKAKGIYNSIASSRNSILDQFEAQSSPEWLAKKTGLRRLDLFKSDIESELGAAMKPQSAAAEKPSNKRIRYEMKGGALMPIQD
jgi:hypothetical protein